jgi:hypothetical protein
MSAFRRAALALAGVAVIVAGCTSITIPSIPPIPTVPPGFTIPPIPSIPPINIPSGLLPDGDPNAAACQYVTPAEMSAIMGAQVSVTSSDDSSCTYTLPSFAAIVVGTSGDTDMTGVRFLFGDSASDLTVGGFPAVSGIAIGQPAVYVQKPNGQLSVLGVLTGSDQATIDRLIQIANTAIARVP